MSIRGLVNQLAVVMQATHQVDF